MQRSTEESRLKQRKILRKSTLIILFGISIAAFLTVYIVKQSPSIRDRYQTADIPDEYLIKDLTAFIKTNQGFSSVNGAATQSQQIVFKSSILRPIYAGLVLSTNHAGGKIVFHGRIPPGRDRLIEKSGKRYIYTVKPEDQSLRFCMVYADDKNDLIQQAQKMRTIFPSIPDAACLNLI